MSETNTSEKLEPAEVEQLTFGSYLFEVVRALGEAFVLGVLLWPMEGVRNLYFRMLDKLGVPARRRHRSSAFPPGPARANKAS